MFLVTHLSLLLWPSWLRSKGKQAFRAPQFWNNLLEEIRLAKSVTVFKSLLKTLFYNLLKSTKVFVSFLIVYYSFHHFIFIILYICVSLV